MKKVWKDQLNQNDFISSKIMREYYKEVDQEAKIVDNNKRRYYDCPEKRNKNVSLKTNPYALALNRMEQLAKKSQLGLLFEYNSRKNARMTQGEINMRKKLKNRFNDQ